MYSKTQRFLVQKYSSYTAAPSVQNRVTNPVSPDLNLLHVVGLDSVDVFKLAFFRYVLS